MQKWFPGRTLILLGHVWSFCHTNSLEHDQKWPISPLEKDLISLLQSIKKGLFFPNNHWVSKALGVRAFLICPKMASFYTFENRVMFLFKQKMFKLFLPYNKCKTIGRVQKKNKLGHERKDFCRISDLVLSNLLFHPHNRPFFTTMPYDIYSLCQFSHFWKSCHFTTNKRF